MEKLLTIVIPTYNMERYLHKCLDSLLINENQELLEVLVINDGSKDFSSKIAHEYGQRFPHMFRVIDKENGNYGSCVNRGLEEATGKYFRILDADDWFDTNELQRFVKALLCIEDTDMIITHFVKIYSNGKRVINRSFAIDYEKKHMDINNLVLDSDLAMHKVTYATSILKMCNLKLQEGISYTDTEFVYYPLSYVQSILYVDVVLYQYNLGRPGQTMDINSRISHSSDLEKIIYKLLEADVLQIDSKIRKAQFNYLVRIISGLYHIYLVLQPLNYENIEKLKLLDRKISDVDAELLEKLQNVKSVGIPYIYYWEKYKLQIIPPSLYKLLLKLRVFMGME